ncbi:uncharacterized protein [Argopecten irradians]|uniref:uncharacterized protein n=1 Tax=Argopecten irradians TaxID=31199 RepID=UPI003711D383
MNKENYMEEGLRQLQDDKHYVPIENHSTEHIIEKIIEKINTMYNDGSIDSTTYKYLVDMKRTGPGKLYLLPKIHKLQQDDFDKYVGRKALLNHHLIPSRPIISQCNSPTMKIGRFIDNFLVPLVQKQETYLKDTKDFINKIEGITLPPKTMLVSYDVTSMYTNMTFGELLEAVERAIPSEHKTDTLPMPPREDITYLLKILLENNEFQFGKQYYKQVIGAAMGAVPSPEICDLRMYEILKCIIERYPYRNSILLHYRYRDDGFMVFACSHEQIKLFFEIANAEHEYLKFTYNTSETEMIFLDTKVYKGNRFRASNILDIQMHIKPTETFQYLHRSSAHPGFVFKGLIKGECIRHMRNTSDPKVLETNLNKFKQRLRKRGYSIKEIETSINTSLSTCRQKLLDSNHTDRHMNVPLVMITKYNPDSRKIRRIITKHWHLITQSTECSEIFPKPPMVSYRKNKNLSEYLTSSTIS